MSEECTTLTVTLKDPLGLVDVFAGDLEYSGEINDAPSTLAVGQRLSMALEPRGSSPFDGLVEVLGKVSHIDGASGPMPNTPLFGGLVLTFEVARMTRSALPFAAGDEKDDEKTVPYAFDFDALNFDVDALKGSIASKVFKRSPLVASLDLMDDDDQDGDDQDGDDQGSDEKKVRAEFPGGEYADTVMVPPPVMTDPGARALSPVNVDDAEPNDDDEANEDDKANDNRAPAGANPPPPFDAASSAGSIDNPQRDVDTVDSPFSELSSEGVSKEGQPTREPTGVIGTLRMISLAEVVQGLELGRKTARIEVRPSEHELGRVFVEQGQIVHVTLGDRLTSTKKEGEDAFYLLARHTTGTYRVSFGRETKSRTVKRPTAYVILEAMRRLDEAVRAEALADQTPDVDGDVDTIDSDSAPNDSMPNDSREETASARALAGSAPGSDVSEDTAGERIPTGVREQVVEALDRVFDSASQDSANQDEGGVINVDEELVIEESLLDGEPSLDHGRVSTGGPRAKGTVTDAGEVESAPPSDPEDVPVFTPAHLSPLDSSPLDSSPDGSPVFDVATGDFTPLATEPMPNAKARLAAERLRARAAPPRAAPPRSTLVFSGFFQEARDESDSGTGDADDSEGDQAVDGDLGLRGALRQQRQQSLPTLKSLQLLSSDVSGETPTLTPGL